jgi:hypothetical protein
MFDIEGLIREAPLSDRAVNLENFRCGVNVLLAARQNMPLAEEQRLREQLAHYADKGGRKRKFTSEHLLALDKEIGKRTVRWDATVIEANMGEVPNLPRNAESFNTLAISVLSQKLVRGPTGDEINKVRNLSTQMFENPEMGNREKLICMDACIDGIVSRADMECRLRRPTLEVNAQCAQKTLRQGKSNTKAK